MARTEQKQIVIKTALHSGIYKSDGGGETRIHYRWTIGPHNLMTAMETLTEHSDSMTRGYGNVGHSGSWIEIASVPMRLEDFHDYDFETDPSNFDDLSQHSAVSKTEWCRKFIASVRDGSLAAERKRIAEFFTAMQNAYDAGSGAAYNGTPRPKYDDYMLDIESERGYNSELDSIHELKQREQQAADEERREQERAQREYEAAERVRQQARAERAERNKQRVIAEAVRLRAIDASQPIADPVMAAVVKSIALITFERGPTGLGEYKSRMLAGQYPDVVRQYVQSDWIFDRVKNVVPREWEMGDDE